MVGGWCGPLVWVLALGAGAQGVGEAILAVGGLLPQAGVGASGDVGGVRTWV